MSEFLEEQESIDEPGNSQPDAQHSQAESTDSEEESREQTAEERHAHLKSVAEALIFATQEPLTEAQFLAVAGKRAKGKLAGLVEELNADYEQEGRAFEILHVAKGYQYFTRTEFSPILRKLFAERSRTRLSRAALETLAVVAFRGPVTRGEIDEIRGVESGGVLRTLLDRRLIMVKGRAEVIGRPMLYETTDEFLHHFGLASLNDLPKHHELTREWGELQQAVEEAEAQEAIDLEEERANDESTDTAEGDTAETPDSSESDLPGSGNGHNELTSVNLGNKQSNSEQ
jgi:segregation and condensation protein B